MVYVDELLVLGDKTPETGTTVKHFGNYCTIGLQDSYTNSMIEQTGMTNCNTVTTLGIIAHYTDYTQKNVRRRRSTTPRTTQKVPVTTMVSVHQTRHCVRKKK